MVVGLAEQQVSGKQLLLIPHSSQITYKQLFVDNKQHLSRFLVCGVSQGPLPLPASVGLLRGGVMELS